VANEESIGTRPPWAAKQFAPFVEAARQVVAGVLGPWHN